MAFCLTKDGEEQLKKAFKARKINPTDLLNMTSKERRNFFGKFLSTEEAKEVNLLFERKLLLVNRQKALLDWAKESTGISREAKEELSKKIRDRYAERKRRVLNPTEEESFLNELAADMYSRKYRIDVSLQEAQEITELSKAVEDAKAKMNDDFTWKNEEDGFQFGAAKVAYDNYVNKLKKEARKQGDKLVPFRDQGIIPFVDQLGRKSGNFIAENSRALKASIDNSFWGRQGIKVFFTHPKTWANNFVKSFSDIAKTIKGGTDAGDAVLDAVKAEIYQRQNYLNGRYELGTKLDIGIAEEEFPTSLPARIPALGRLFKASEVSYESGAMRLRVDLADKIYEMAEKTGVDMTDKEEVGEINKLINSMTGRGYLGRFEGDPAKDLNNVFFSIKFFKSNLEVLTKPFSAKTTKFVRKEASKNLLKMIAGVGLILGIANQLNDDFVEGNPTSSDFGKIRVGNTRFDVTGGMSTIPVLIARIIRQETKSTQTGIVRKLNEDFGSPTGMDLFWQTLFENKLSPIGSVIANIIKRERFGGEKLTIAGSIEDLTVPIVLTTTRDTKKADGLAMGIIALLSDALGVSANTYSVWEDWNNKNTKQLEEFKDRVGQKKFDEANEEFNKEYQKKFDSLINSYKYKGMSDEDKQKEVTKLKKEVKDKIINKYK